MIDSPSSGDGACRVRFLLHREKIDLRMANATPSASSTKETTNYARLCRLLVDIGTQALRDTLDAIHAPANLHTVLAEKKKTLKSLRAKKVINPIQWGKLFPVIPTSVSSRDFDITLLMILLRHLCGLTAPPTGWDALPATHDLRKEADIARVKYFRNTVYGHAEKASVDDIDFNDYWRDIRDILVRLGGVTYEAAIDDLRNETMDPETKDHYVELLNQWKKDENSIKDQLDEINKKLEFLTSKDIKDEGQPEQGAEANFTVITRDSGGQKFHNEQEQVTVTVSYQTRDKEVQVVDCKVCYKPKSVSRHDVEIKVNKCSLTGSPSKVEEKPHQYKVVRSSGSGELSGPYCIAKNEITGDIAVADYMNKRVQIFDKDMKHVKMTIGGKADSQLCAKIGCPVSVAFSKSNDIMITHEQYRSQNKKLSVITDLGLFIEHFT
ncbi:uncharacterized protein LOC111319817 isoform X1 [Stylophora pistillata]|uniref:uncharacterized protein LOC111319817 isoform X1 n=2 Tax=Stylophora pistillata TaxID=50429 RepID=UPI000C056148|nr:uncharacterized protein LOC111319817 isoform X1 [Stylophora pistillata]